MLQTTPLHGCQAPGFVPAELADEGLGCGGGQLPFDFVVRNRFAALDLAKPFADGGEKFDALGDVNRAVAARALRRSLDTRQVMVGMGLLAVGVLGILGSLWSRWRWREAEVW